MKKVYWINPIIFTAILLFLAMGCKKDEPATIPHVSTAGITGITTTTAISGGNITADGGATITARGVCWSTEANPTTSDSKTADGVGIGRFVSNISGLTTGKIYHIRAYATNSAGTAYGDDFSFLTSIIITLEVTNITATTAVLVGTIIIDECTAVTAMGVHWSTRRPPWTPTPCKQPCPQLFHTTNDGAGTGSFSSNLTGLKPSTTYYVRAYVTIYATTVLGKVISFKTSP